MNLKQKKNQLVAIQAIAKQLKKQGFDSESNLSKSNVSKHIKEFDIDYLEKVPYKTYDKLVEIGEIDEHKTWNFFSTMLKLELTFLDK